jgi:CheY-like chemotaxis protein
MLYRVFEMFTQVDVSLEKSQGGLGIGLSLAKWMVEMHGGSIEARSDGHGLGSEFLVRLPVALALAQEHYPDEGERKVITSRRKILIVDDNRDAAASLALMLQVMGNETRIANDGLAALEIAPVFAPDLVMLDIGMPRLNGYDTAPRMREQPWGKNLMLVALTGWGQSDDKRKSHEAGFDKHMVKPIDPGALEKLLLNLRADTA